MNIHKEIKNDNKAGFIIKKNIIELNLTNFCNLSCINCCSSCRQAPDKSYLPAKKILKFINESSGLDYKWGKIKLWGGEPTTNPDFFKIIEILKEYKLKNPKTKIAILTNGIGKAVKNKLSKLPSWVIIRDSSKAEGLNKTEAFESFNIAPIDLKNYKDADYSKGCWRLERCGIGLGENGYYACGPMIHIDRVFGFNRGLKNLKQVLNSTMEDQLKLFCRYCGLYKNPAKKISKEIISKTWKKAYSDYKKKPPVLNKY